MEENSAGTVLIVDDNEVNIQLLGAILKKENYKIGIALSGSEALQFLAKEKVDIILLDVMMPDMDGYEVCSIIKKDESLKTIPIIFLTAKNGHQDIMKGFKAGAVDYVTKPFNSKELLARVSVHVELVRSRLEIKNLKTFLPICSSCKNIRNDTGCWCKIESYFAEHTNVDLSHGMCPDCLKKLYPELFDGNGVIKKSTKQLV